MRARRWHRLLGLAMAVPIFVWAATGLLFHVKPGWSAAYGSLTRPELPLAAGTVVVGEAGWLEVRRLRTTLGEHLLVRDANGWKHLDATTLAPFPQPAEPALTSFVASAIAATDGGPERYGRIVGRDGEAFVTASGVRITLDWTSLRFAQQGRDTDRIDLLYRIHYLQWTGVPAIDRPFALAGLAGLAALAVVGLRLAFRPASRREP